jgi:hypothetical protein
MARITFGTYDRNLLPAWIGDYLNRERMLPAGGQLDASAFTETNGVRYVPSGTLVGRTFAERAAGEGFGPVAVGGDPAAVTDDEVYLIIFDVIDANTDPDVELYRHGGVVKVNYLPGWDSLNAAVQAFILEHYATQIGAQ